jgi:hypothetical protein
MAQYQGTFRKNRVREMNKIKWIKILKAVYINLIFLIIRISNLFKKFLESKWFILLTKINRFY